MIHLITQANRHLYREALSALHEERRRQFIDGRGWPLRQRDGGEYDAYDDDLAEYLVGFSAVGAIESACRLRPALTGGVIADVFPHLVARQEPSPRSPGTWECTRYFCTAPGRAGFLSRSSLHLAMIERMREVGGDRLLGFVDLGFLIHLRRFSGLRIRPVGLPAGYGEGDAAGVTIAFEIGVSETDLAATRARLDLPGRQLFEAPAWLPAATDVLTLERIAAVLIEAPAPAREALATEASELSARHLRRPDVAAVMAELEKAA